ncbi:lipoprotein [Moraxella haemolytica]|uniref:lipoprotein n=1 Tax=Moraxella TaxID=475 RepID=UPI0025432CA6|nr:lipoprotein [Moraxella sp. ZY171148]WII96115.1 lipoprotein [Moraxella sp. ZY171148]
MKHMAIVRILLAILTVLVLTGCQHIQVTRSPLPVTLKPNATQQAMLDNSHVMAGDQPLMLSPTNSLIKNKSDAKKYTGLTKFYLLESWF